MSRHTDRCDRCGAAALFSALMPSGSLILLCGHHRNEHESALIGQGAHIEAMVAEPAAKAVEQAS